MIINIGAIFRNNMAAKEEVRKTNIKRSKVHIERRSSRIVGLNLHRTLT